MIALPAWQKACTKFDLHPRLIPQDVIMRWHSTYDMICFAIKYRKPIYFVTADRGLKLRKFELDEEEWGLVKDLVDVLEVRSAARTSIMAL